MAVRIRVTGVRETMSGLYRLGRRIAGAVQGRAEAASVGWEDTLKATLQHVVYDVYEPKVYKRNMNLIRAVDRRVSAGIRGPMHVVHVRLFDNEEKITYRRRADGSIGPRGGSPPWRVPWEIELGQWPIPWHGYTAARPAYAVTAGLIAPEAARLADDAVREAVFGG